MKYLIKLVLLDIKRRQNLKIIEQKFTTLEEAASTLAVDLSNTLRDAISTRGQSLLAVSGGNTPRKVFKYLREQRVDWNKVTITLTDERWIPNDNAESNEQLVHSYLLKYLSEDTTFIPFYYFLVIYSTYLKNASLIVNF